MPPTPPAPPISRLLIPLLGDEVAPRFDLATEVWLGDIDPRQGRVLTSAIIVLPQASAEDLCQLALKENVNVVVVGGIEDEFWDYLQWKKITVLDSVAATADEAALALAQGRLAVGDALLPRVTASRS